MSTYIASLTQQDFLPTHTCVNLRMPVTAPVLFMTDAGVGLSRADDGKTLVVFTIPARA